MLEPADSQEAYAMTLAAFELSERFRTPVILRLTTRICHVKGVVVAGERAAVEPSGFVKAPARWVMVPGNAKPRMPLMYEREAAVRAASETSPLNFAVDGPDKFRGWLQPGDVVRLEVQELGAIEHRIQAAKPVHRLRTGF